MKKLVVLLSLTLVLLASVLYSSCNKQPEPTVPTVNSSFTVQISDENSCGELSANCTIKNNRLTSHIEVSNTSDTDTTYIYFDDVLLMKAVGRHLEKDYNTTVSQGQHCFHVENSCGSMIDCFSVNISNDD